MSRSCSTNYAAIVLGVTQGRAAIGLPYQLARLAAGACEAAFLFSWRQRRWAGPTFMAGCVLAIVGLIGERITAGVARARVA